MRNVLGTSMVIKLLLCTTAVFFGFFGRTFGSENIEEE